MKRLLMAAACLLPMHAYAWDYNQYGPGQQIGDNASGVQNNNRANANANAAASARSASKSTAGATGGSVNIGSAGNSSGGSFVGFNNPGGGGMASCGGGLGLGGIGLGGGGSAGGSIFEFRDCKVLREAAELANLGHADIGTIEICQQIDRVREAFGGTCPTLTPPIIAQSQPRPVMGYMGACLPPDVRWADGSCHSHAAVHAVYHPKPKAPPPPCLCKTEEKP